MAARDMGSLLGSTDRRTDHHTTNTGISQRSLEHLSIDDMVTFRQVIKEEIDKRQVDLQILFVGRTGHGKSSLVNGLIGRILAEEGARFDSCTHTVNEYVYIDSNISVSLFDCPGLQDLKSNEKEYIEKIKTKCRSVDVVVYCMSVKDHRISNDDKEAAQKFLINFSQHFWKHVVIALTFANKEDCEKWDERDEDDESQEPPFDDQERWNTLKKDRFINRMKKREEEIKDFLREKVEVQADIVHRIPVIPTGYYKPTVSCPTPLILHNGSNWLLNLSRDCCSVTKRVQYSKLDLIQSTCFNVAFIIDNMKNDDGQQKSKEADAQENPPITDQQSIGRAVSLSPQAEVAFDALNSIGFAVLPFSNLSPLAIQALFCQISSLTDFSRLASFLVIVLSNGKNSDAVEILASSEDLFHRLVAISFDNYKMFLHFHCNAEEKPIALRLINKSYFPRCRNGVFFSVCIPKATNAHITMYQCMKIFANEIKTQHNTSLQDMFVNVRDKCSQRPAQCVLYEGNNSNHCLHKISVNCQKKILIFKREILYKVCHELVDKLLEDKDSIIKVLKTSSGVKIGSHSVGLVSAGIAVVGLALMPVTFGASIALSATAAAVGIAGAGVGIGTQVASKIKVNKQLKKVKELLDMYLQVVFNYNESIQQCEDQRHQNAALGVSVVRGFGAAAKTVATVVEGGLQGATAVAEGASGAVRSVAIGSAVVGGVAAVVTVPLDIALIAHSGYILHKAIKGESDESKWIQQQIEGILKGLFHIVCQKDFIVVGSAFKLCEWDECGFKLIMHNGVIPAAKECKVTVKSVFAGPFEIPFGSTLVSGIYDISISEELNKPITVKIEHCVDIESELIASKMSFVIAECDVHKKQFKFIKSRDGLFEIKKTIGLLGIHKSCIIGIIYCDKTTVASNNIPDDGDDVVTDVGDEVHLMSPFEAATSSGLSDLFESTSFTSTQYNSFPLKYAILKFFHKKFKNYWEVKIIAMKHLKAHFKYARNELKNDEMDAELPFKFNDQCNISSCIGFNVDDAKDGWTVTTHRTPCEIFKKDIDEVELIYDFNFPNLAITEMTITVDDDPLAADILHHQVMLTGIKLIDSMTLVRQKET